MKKSILLVLVFGLTLGGCDAFQNSKKERPQQGQKDQTDPRDGIDVSTEKPVTFSEPNMLVTLGDFVILPAIKSFEKEVEILQRYISDFGISEQSQSQWKRTMLKFHKMDAAAVGKPFERGLWVYSYPEFSSCKVDKKVVYLKNHGGFLDEEEYQSQGLAAIEYLLFDEQMKTDCNRRRNPDVRAWTKLSVEEKKADRLKLLKVLAERTLGETKKIMKSWQSGYTKRLADGSEYGSVKKSINKITDALLKVEQVKNVRVGAPFGLYAQLCPPQDEEFCPEYMEHRYSGFGLEAIRARVEGMRDVFLGMVDGKNEFGLDDLLESYGKKELSDEFLSRTDLALKTIEEIGTAKTLPQMLDETDYAACAGTTAESKDVKICALYYELQGVVRFFRGRILVSLALQAPYEYQDDGDSNL